MNILDALTELYTKVVGSAPTQENNIGGMIHQLAEKWPASGSEPPANATTETPGLVKQAANVAAAVGEAPTKAEFDGLLTALKDAGIMAADG